MWPSLTNCLHYLIEQKKKTLKFHSVPIEKPLDKMFLLLFFWSKILWSILGNIDFSFNIQPLASLLVLSRVVWRERGKYSASSQLIIMSEAQSRGKKGACMWFRCAQTPLLCVWRLCFAVCNQHVRKVSALRSWQEAATCYPPMNVVQPHLYFKSIILLFISVVICVISLLQLEMKKKSAFSVIITVKSLFSYFVA